MSEAINFSDSICPVEDQPFLFDFSDDLNGLHDDITTITSITVDAAAVTAGFETYDPVIFDVNNDGELTKKGGVVVWFKVNAAKQSDVYWDYPGNEVIITVLVTTSGGIKMALTGVLTVSQPS